MASEGFESEDEWIYDEGDLLDVTYEDRAITGIELITSIQSLSPRPKKAGGEMPYYVSDLLVVEVNNFKTRALATFTFADKDGERILLSIDKLASYTKNRHLTSRQIQSLPAGKVRTELNKLLKHLEAKGEGDLGVVASLSDWKPKDLGRRGGERSVLTDFYLLAVAIKYNGGGGAPDTTRNLANWGNVSEATMRKHIQKARERGYLEETVERKKNWNLTPKALRQINEYEKFMKGKKWQR